MDIHIEIKNTLSKKDEMELKAKRQEILNKIAINDYVINHLEKENKVYEDEIYKIEKILVDCESNLVSSK